MYKKHLSYLREALEGSLTNGNFKRRPSNSKMSDIEVIALAVTAEANSIDSENLLFSKLRSDYGHHFPNLIDRTRFNRRRRGLEPWIREAARRLGASMDRVDSPLVVDSMPCPVIRNARERSMKICREEHCTAPRKGYSAVDRRYYVGYKLHMIINTDGIFHDMAVTPANVHDINFLKDRQYDGSEEREILGDRGYISASLRADLFSNYGITLNTPPRSNQKTAERFSPDRRKNRKLIETRFSQLCSQFSIKTNLAKTFRGFNARLASKVAGVAVLQKLNLEKGRPINQIRHAWSN